MFKYFFSFFIILLFCSCNTNSPYAADASDIIELQKKSTKTQEDSSYQYLKRAEQLILENSHLELDSLLTENYFALGDYFANTKQKDSAIYYRFKGILSIDRISNQREVNFFFDTWYDLKSLSKYGDCKKLVEEFEKKVAPDDFVNISLGYYFRENIAKSEKNYVLALEHNEKRVEFLEKLNNDKAMVPALISRATIYNKQNNKNKAYEILNTLIEKETNLSYDTKRQIYGNYAVYKFYDSQFEESLFYNKKALENTKADNTPSSQKNNFIATAYANIAEIHIELKQYTLAQIFLDSIYSIGFNKIRESTQRNILKYQLLLQPLSETGPRTTNKLLDSIFNYQDKSYQQKYNQELVALKIEIQKKEEILKEQQNAEIKAINLENRLTIVMISSVLIIFIGVLYFFLRKYRQEKKALHLQQRLLRTQMSPHFIFNTLSSIHNVMSTNTARASTYLIKFSKLLRLVLENSLENYVPLEDEIESIEQFLELQLFRFPEKFVYIISLDKLDPAINYAIPPMLLQPFIENSILHGFKGIDYIGQINLSLSKKNKYLQCVIEDNGIGIQNMETSIKKSISIGLISDFLQKATRAKVSIVSKTKVNEEKSGVRVSFLIPRQINT